MTTAPLVSMRSIVKTFAQVRANDAIDLQINPGEVLALLGENGAGKSTLMKILYGYYQADAGSIEIDQQPCQMHSPNVALACGIGMVFQQFTLIPALTIWENLLLAFPQTPWWPGRRHPALVSVLQTLHTLAPQLDPDRRVGDLSVGEQQLVELAKVMNLAARILILDEPTAVLTPIETERLYDFIRGYVATGRAVVLITHKLADVHACADRIVVLRGGRVVAEHNAVTCNSETLVADMVGSGRSVPSDAPVLTPVAIPQLQVKELSARTPSGAIEAVSFTVASGEILGIAGVVGNGQDTLAASLVGLITAASGEVLLDGEAIQRQPGQPAKVAANIAYIPEQPLQNAVVAELDASTNLNLRRLPLLGRFPNRGREKQRARQLMQQYAVRPADPAIVTAALSGGNLQKLVIGRELSGDARLVVACFPTMGLDIQAAAFIYDELFRHAANGACVVWLSEDLDDLMRYAHRIAVLHAGRIMGIVEHAQATRQLLGRWMAGSTGAGASAACVC